MFDERKTWTQNNGGCFARSAPSTNDVFIVGERLMSGEYRRCRRRARAVTIGEPIDFLSYRPEHQPPAGAKDVQ
jgi:hypothetical protein